MHSNGKPTNKTLTESEFLGQRESVLKMWKTGREVDLEDGISYQRKTAPELRMANKVEAAAAEGRCLAMPVAGVNLIDEHISLLQALEKEGGADLMPCSIDSQTRCLDFEEAEGLMAESAKAGKSLMNGFPIVNHGVQAVRKVHQSINTPIITRMQAVDSRLAAEISFAGGFTGFTGGSMTSFTCYSKHTTLPDTIRYYQYLDRLAGYYTERGCSMVRELQGYNIGLAYPHSLGIAYIIIDCLLAAQQGVKSFMLTRHQQGSFLQDVAASRVQTELTGEYLHKAGLDDVKVYPLLRQWLGTFPINHAEGYSVISLGAAIGVLAGCSIIVLKTVDEGTALPRKEINIESTKCVKAVINQLAGQRFPDSPELREEMDVLRTEVRAIIDKLYEAGDGDFAKGVCIGMERGFIDAPFAPNVHVSDRVRPIRDATGAIRMLEFGNLPLPEEVKRYHRERIAEREAKEGFTAGMDQVVSDIMEGALRVSV